MRSITCHLIVGLDGSVRAVKNRPRTNPTEVVVQVNLVVPTPPKIAAVLDIELPEPPAVNVDYAVEQWSPLDDGGDIDAEDGP